MAARTGHAGIVQAILGYRKKAINALRGAAGQTAGNDNGGNGGGSDEGRGKQNGGGSDDEVDGGSGGGSEGGSDAPELEDDPVEARDHTESMPLHWAAEGGHLAAVEMLVDAGAALNMVG